MRGTKQQLKLERRQLDRRLKGLKKLAHSERPRNGWIKAIRESLGMSATQLGKRLGIAQSNVTALEQGEIKGTPSLQTLQKAAAALNCRLVYAFLPPTSLEKMIDQQALTVARTIVRQVSHSMILEQQQTNSKKLTQQIQETADELKNTLSSRLWNEP